MEEKSKIVLTQREYDEMKEYVVFRQSVKSKLNNIETRLEHMDTKLDVLNGYKRRIDVIDGAVKVYGIILTALLGSVGFSIWHIFQVSRAVIK